MYRKVLKPCWEFVNSTVLLVLLLPMILLLTIFGIIFFKGNPFFIQQRTGLYGKIFQMFKFRTMKGGKVTSYGNVLRKYSLDELPQLFHVLTGQMSLIGPRPLLPEYLPLFNEFQRKRLLVKPGISGLAQVNGRNEIAWGEKFVLDVWYVENLSFMLDLKIAFKTLFQLKNRNTQPTEIFKLVTGH